ncbi:hypothetical protein [Mammaliicoccus sciuri]|uniref:hypothetical protein n=1 Tax=Mammaliicoccus sciuri TaxID=1296 RepID=UPI003F54D68E
MANKIIPKETPIHLLSDEQRLARYKKRYVKPKPWLEKYPQKTVRGEYCKHLWENDIFPKRKVEC